MLGHLFGIGREGGAFTGREIIHPHPVGFKPDLLQKRPDMVNPFPAPIIAFIIMTGPFQTADAINPIGTLLDGSQQMDHIYFSGTGDQDDLDIGRILESHGTCQVRG